MMDAAALANSPRAVSGAARSMAGRAACACSRFMSGSIVLAALAVTALDACGMLR